MSMPSSYKDKHVLKTEYLFHTVLYFQGNEKDLSTSFDIIRIQQDWHSKIVTHATSVFYLPTQKNLNLFITNQSGSLTHF